MMIRINLLPVRAVKKREMGRQILAIYAVALLVTAILFWLFSSYDPSHRVKSGASLSAQAVRSGLPLACLSNKPARQARS